MRALATLLFALPLAGLAPAPLAAQAPLPPIALERVASGLTLPVGLTHAGDGSRRLFILEQLGTIRIVKQGRLLPTPFLDISSLVTHGGEQGLLGLAFHPGYSGNGLFYINYTDTAGNTVVARYQVSAANPDLADSNSAQTVLRVAQPFANHNGGGLGFGPDGYLYIPLGDGGNAGDPGDRAQNGLVPLGKILRVDVDGDDFPGDPDKNYHVPASNPFVGNSAYLPEVWALGLRNPWRWSFDRATGDLWIGDVGQGSWEEIDLQPASSTGGENYGWRCYEGNHSFNSAGCQSASAYVFPIYEYDHGPGCSVTGGYRYRGPVSAFAGIYFFGDYCSGQIFGATFDGAGWTVQVALTTPYGISSFGEDEAGEIYLVHHGGEVYRIVSAIFADGFETGDLVGWGTIFP